MKLKSLVYLFLALFSVYFSATISRIIATKYYLNKNTPIDIQFSFLSKGDGGFKVYYIDSINDARFKESKTVQKEFRGQDYLQTLNLNTNKNKIYGLRIDIENSKDSILFLSSIRLIKGNDVLSLSPHQILHYFRFNNSIETIEIVKDELAIFYSNNDPFFTMIELNKSIGELIFELSVQKGFLIFPSLIAAFLIFYISSRYFKIK